jgi:hypothetical protein
MYKVRSEGLTAEAGIKEFHIREDDGPLDRPTIDEAFYLVATGIGAGDSVQLESLHPYKAVILVGRTPILAVEEVNEDGNHYLRLSGVQQKDDEDPGFHPDSRRFVEGILNKPLNAKRFVTFQQGLDAQF